MALPFFLHLLANPSNDQLDLAESLLREQSVMQRLFSRLNPIPEENVQYEAHPESDWDLLDSFRSKPTIRRDMTYFHFSGHGENGNLIFQSKDGDQNEAKKRGLASTLEAFPNLGLIFLNCCTSDLLAQEIAKDGRIVIASPYVVPTDLAVEMAESFYKHLTEDNSIWDSFLAARDNLDVIPGDTYRSLFPDEADELPDPKEIFQFYPHPEAKAAKWTISRLRELNQLDKENPTAGSEPKLLRPLLHFNFRDQKRATGNKEKLMAYLIQGKKEHGIPLIFWMFKEPYIARNSLRLPIDLATGNRSYQIDTYWTELGKKLGLDPKIEASGTEEAGKKISKEDVVKAVASRLEEPGKDILISVYNAQYYGKTELQKLVTEFWYPLRTEVMDAMFPLSPMSRMRFFLILEDDKHAEKTDVLSSEEGIFAFVPEPTKLTKEDLWNFLDRERYWLLSETHQDSWQEISDKIFERCAGVPGDALQMLCRLSDDKYDKLNKTFIEI